MMFFSRILDGILGGNISLAQAYVADLTTDKERARCFGLIGAAFGIGFIFGPAIGGTLSVYGYRIPAFAAAFVAFVNLVGVAFMLPESLPAEKRLTSSQFSYRSPFASVQSAWRVPMLRVLILLRFSYGFTFTLFESAFGYFNLLRLNLDARHSSYLLVVVGIVFSCVQGGGIRSFTRRYSEFRLIYGSFIFLAFSLVYWSATYSFTTVVFGLVCIALASGILNTLINSEITKQVEQSQMGGMLGLSAAVGSMTRVLAPVSAGWSVDAFGVASPGLLGGSLMFAMAYVCNTHRELLTASSPTDVGEKAKHSPEEKVAGESSAGTPL